MVNTTTYCVGRNNTNTLQGGASGKDPILSVLRLQRPIYLSRPEHSSLHDIDASIHYAADRTTW